MSARETALSAWIDIESKTIVRVSALGVRSRAGFATERRIVQESNAADYDLRSIFAADFGPLRSTSPDILLDHTPKLLGVCFCH